MTAASAVLASALGVALPTLLVPAAAEAAANVPTVSCETPASAFINTGFDGSNIIADGLADDNWDVSYGDVDEYTGYNYPDGIGTDSELPPSDAVWHPTEVGKVNPQWASSPYSDAQWISAKFIAGGGEGNNQKDKSGDIDGSDYANADFYYRSQFSLDPNVDPAAITLSADWFADNNVSAVWVNDKKYSREIGYDGYGYVIGASWNTDLSEGWKTGLNTIIVEVKSTSSAEGFFVQPTPGPLCEKSLSIVKSADVQSARTGDVVTYTITATNTGGMNFTADDPAVVVDDLSGVIDDATYNGDASASATGEIGYQDPRLSWSGALDVGQSVSITYSVTVTNNGDHQMDNVACASGTGVAETCDDVSVPLPHVIAEKVSDPVSGSGVRAGQVIAYTLTWRNDGTAAGIVDSTDDLTRVLDDADVTSEPVSDTDGVTAVRDGNRLRIEGPIAAGQTVTVTYQVTVKADGARGDDDLVNTLVPDEPCAEGSCPTPVEHPVGEVDSWKTVDPGSGTTVQQGDVLTYTLHFQNTGKADAEFTRDDVLTQVLDDADVTSQPVASDSALAATSISDARFQVSGTLAPGQEETVVYQVTIRPDGQRGDDRLLNFLVGPGQEPPSECVPDADEHADCTVNHVNVVTVTKSSDPESGSTVQPGQAVTYTLSFSNASRDPEAAPAQADYTDHMVDVLDDATLSTAPSTSDDRITATVDGDTIRIVGTVPSGATFTVSYTVTVKAYDEQRNHHLGNVIAITGEEPVCAPGSQLCTSHDIPPAPVDAGETTLAITGGAVPLLSVGAAVVLLAAGVVLVMVRRRRTVPADSLVQGPQE